MTRRYQRLNEANRTEPQQNPSNPNPQETTMTEQTKTVDPIKAVAKLIAERTKLTARLAEIEVELAPLADVAAAAEKAAEARKAIDVTGLDTLTEVNFEFGRRENRKTLRGNVVAFQPAGEKTPARYKIETGSGFDTEIYVVFSRDVSLVSDVAAG